MTVRFCGPYHFGHRTHNSQNTHTTEKILYSMHLTSALNCFEKKHANTANSYHNLGATQHSLGDFHSALGSYQHALLLICLEKNKNALLIVLMALH